MCVRGEKRDFYHDPPFFSFPFFLFSFLVIIILVLKSFLTSHGQSCAWCSRKQDQVKRASRDPKFPQVRALECVQQVRAGLWSVRMKEAVDDEQVAEPKQGFRATKWTRQPEEMGGGSAPVRVSKAMGGKRWGLPDSIFRKVCTGEELSWKSSQFKDTSFEQVTLGHWPTFKVNQLMSGPRLMVCLIY